MPVDNLELDTELKQAEQDMQADEAVVEQPVEKPVEQQKTEVKPEVKEAPKVEVKPEIKPEVKPEPPLPSKEQEIITNLQKALKETRHEYNEKLDKFKTEFIELKTKLTQPEAKPPDPNEDPLGYQQHQIKQLEKQNQEIQEKVKTQAQDTEHQKFIMHVNTLETAFRSKQPDYDTAFNYLKEFKAQELAEYGIVDPQKVAMELGRMSVSISAVALQNGRNPAEVIYGLAKRYGYKQAEIQKETKKDVETVIKESAKEHLETIAKGQDKAKNLGAGDDVEDKISIEAMLKEKDSKKFDEMWNEFFKDEIK